MGISFDWEVIKHLPRNSYLTLGGAVPEIIFGY